MVLQSDPSDDETLVRELTSRADVQFARVRNLASIGLITFRGLRNGDEAALEKFRREIGDRSRMLFAPYPWHDEGEVALAFQKAISRHLAGSDFTGIAEFGGVPVAHFALWGVVPAKNINRETLVVPTLGLAVADRFQLKGIGTASVQYLKQVARSLRVDAIELTTTKDNMIAQHVYRKCGFVRQGTLTIPLGIEPSRSIEDCGGVETWRAETYMLCSVSGEKASLASRYCLEKMNLHSRLRPNES